MKAKFTEGPYFASNDTGADCPNHANGGLAVIDTGRESDWPIARHVEWNNVPLLLAAPDLYAALKAVIANHCADDRIFCGTCTDARKVIKKAEGAA